MFILCLLTGRLTLLLVQTFSSGKRTGGDFVQCLVSPQGGWVHCVAEDSHLYSFEIKEGELIYIYIYIHIYIYTYDTFSFVDGPTLGPNSK